MNSIYLITAAGGNGTAIKVLDQALSRDDYAREGKQLGNDMEQYGAEQAGFLIPSDRHFEMAGGEFCGNATRSAAVLLSEHLGQGAFSFTVSGFSGVVNAQVQKTDEKKYFVSCTFPNLPTDQREVVLPNGGTAQVVDLGGIVHVIINGEFPKERAEYESEHRAIVSALNLSDRDAVGVVWYEQSGDSVLMHPVVWVRSVDTFFYEESCGSGTIAVGKVTGVSKIVQPSGKSIEAFIGSDEVILQSEMEVVREGH